MKSVDILRHLNGGDRIGVQYPNPMKPDEKVRYFLVRAGKSVTQSQFRNMRDRLKPCEFGLFDGIAQTYEIAAE